MGGPLAFGHYMDHYYMWRQRLPVFYPSALILQNQTRYVGGSVVAIARYSQAEIGSGGGDHLHIDPLRGFAADDSLYVDS